MGKFACLCSPNACLADLPHRRRTVISAAFVPLDILDTLSTLIPGSQAFLEYSTLVPNPFTKILDTRTRYPVGAMSLGDINGFPILGVVHRPRTVAFFDLRVGTRALIKLGAVSGYTEWVGAVEISHTIRLINLSPG